MVVSAVSPFKLLLLAAGLSEGLRAASRADLEPLLSSRKTRSALRKDLKSDEGREELLAFARQYGGSPSREERLAIRDNVLAWLQERSLGRGASVSPASQQAEVSPQASVEAQPGVEESPVAVPAASVSTDKADYAPGSTVTITAEGFKEGSTIEFTIVDDPAGPGADGDVDIYGSFYATDGGAGDLDGERNSTVLATWTVPCDDDGTGSGTPDALDATLLLTAFYELSRFDESFPNCVPTRSFSGSTAG